MSHGGLDAVLPLTGRDLARSEILRRSLDRFFTGLGVCWVVSPDADVEAVKRAIGDPGYRVLPESEIIPELKLYKGLRHALRRKTDLGWNVQQIIKLGIANHIASDFYLVLDADVICVRPVSVQDLVRDGRGRVKRFSPDIHQGWYECAARLLNLPKSQYTHSVTPCVLNKYAALQLQRHLSDQIGFGERILARLLPTPQARDLAGSWRGYLLRHLGWSEYSLYHTYLEGKGLWELYHFEAGSTGIAWNSVWTRDDIPTWDPAHSFVGDGNYFFSVVQSNTGIGVLDVWERVRSYLADGIREENVSARDS